MADAATALCHASEEVRGDRQAVLQAVRQHWMALEYASEELRNDREVVLLAISACGLALASASAELRACKDVVLKAVTQCGGALAYASEALQADNDVVVEALEQDPGAFEFACEKMRGTLEVACPCLRRNGLLLRPGAARPHRARSGWPRGAMRLGHAVWRALPRTGAGAARAAPEAPDFWGAAGDLGLRPKLDRKPWALLSDARAALEDRLGLATDELLVALASWLEHAAEAPACVGLAHVSGNVYFGPALDFGVAHMSPEQVLVANLFSHGEIGLDAVAWREPPARAASALLREVVTFKRMRWLDASSMASCSRTNEQREPRAAKVPFRLQEAGSGVRPVRASVLSRHPLASEVLGVSSEGGGIGNCLQHPNFGHRDIWGEGIEELQAALAQIAAARAYQPPSEGGQEPAAPDEQPLVGCAVRTSTGSLYAGSVIGVRGGVGTISPLQTALVSVGANGAQPASVVSAIWAVQRAGAEAAEIRERDEALLAAAAPGASLLARGG